MAREPTSHHSLSAHGDAVRGYLFHCRGDASLKAISIDRTARNIGGAQCFTGWDFDAEVSVGVQEAMPVAIAPEPVLRGLRAYGYYVWREGSNPKATTQ